MHTDRRTLPHRLDDRTIDAVRKRLIKQKQAEGRRSQLIEAQLDLGVPLALAIRIANGAH